MMGKYKGILLFIIGFSLIGISIYLFLYSRIDLIKEKVFSEVELLIADNGNDDNSECICDNNPEDSGESNQQENNNIEINTDYIENDDKVENDKPNNVVKKDYIGYLIIPRISLNYGLVAKDSYYNHIDRNIQIIKESDFPNVEGGNLIIAGHSGTASISYFKNLHLLKVDDLAKVIYKGKTYTYKITNIYKDDRNGSVVIKRDKTKTTLTLVTCSYKDKKNHTVYIAELQSVL